jgi:hypothetical protein
MRWLLLILMVVALSFQPSQGRTQKEYGKAETIQIAPGGERREYQWNSPPINQPIVITSPSASNDKSENPSLYKSTTDEKEHFQKEEVLMRDANNITRKLVCLTAALAGVNVLIAGIYFAAMLTSIRAANAAKQSSDTLRLTERPWIVALLNKKTTPLKGRQKLLYEFWSEQHRQKPGMDQRMQGSL